MGNYTEFRRAVHYVVTAVNFDTNVQVSVFETTIRVLGGLLSAHLLATDPKLGIYSNSNTHTHTTSGSSLHSSCGSSSSSDSGSSSVHRRRSSSGSSSGRYSKRNGSSSGTNKKHKDESKSSNDGVSMQYNGELLLLAKDLGDRLLKAFNTTTGVPFMTVNLKHGVSACKYMYAINIASNAAL
jgi:Glycosyl hydrolase family 47